MRAVTPKSARTVPFLALLALTSALALGVAPSAQAANIVPNPGFETDCSGVPCQWNPTSSGDVARDTSVHHTGAASLRLTSKAINEFTASASSACVQVTPGTTYNMRIWYLTTSPITQVTFSASFFSGTDCTGSNFNPGGALTNSPVTNGTWQSITGQTTATTNPPFDAHSAILQITFSCSVECPNNFVVYYDDAEMDTSPLAVRLTSLSARRSAKGVVVRWRTATEVDTLGFNVFRQRGDRRVRLNRRLIPALTATRGGVRGGAYSFVDHRAPKRAVRYWLQEVDARGHRTWHGSIRVRAT